MKIHFFYIFSLILFASCASKEKQSEKEASKKDSVIVTENVITLSPEQSKNAGIETGKPELKYISSSLKVNGEIDVPPQNLVIVSVPMGGYLKSTSLLPGMPVRKGQVVAKIEDQQYIQLQQDYLTAKAKVAYLEKEYERQRDLNQSKATSDKQFQQTEAEFRSQKVLASGLFQKLQLININPTSLNENTISKSINIYSPISGFVSKVNVSTGKYVTPSDELFEIINPSSIHLSLNVFEKDLGKIFIGQPVLAYSNNNPNKKYNCKIILINQDVSRERNAEVHCHFEHYDKDLIPGMFMTAEIELSNSQAYVLPEDAVVSYENKNYVFITKNRNQFEMIEVQTGTHQEGLVELAGNNVAQLAKQDLVVKGAYSLLMKLKNTGDEE
jgi:membrane fusion protein, heavy metal efflux system